MKQLFVHGAENVDVLAFVAEGSTGSADVFAGNRQAQAIAAFKSGPVLDHQRPRARRKAHVGEGERDALVKMNPTKLERLVSGVLEFDVLKIIGCIRAAHRRRRRVIHHLADMQPGKIVFELGIGQRAPANDAARVQKPNPRLGLRRAVERNRSGISDRRRRGRAPE